MLRFLLLSCFGAYGCVGNFGVKVAPCEGETCSGHGECVVVEEREVCECEVGYLALGLTCVADCSAVSCSSRGDCAVVEGEPVCFCAPGYVALGLSCINASLSDAGGPDGGAGDGAPVLDSDTVFDGAAQDIGVVADGAVDGGGDGPSAPTYWCGDGTCDDGELAYCPSDCVPTCGDGVCQDGETVRTCLLDCGCQAPGLSCAAASSRAPGGCFCDDLCAGRGDCCADVCAACGRDCCDGVQDISGLMGTTISGSLQRLSSLPTLTCNREGTSRWRMFYSFVPSESDCLEVTLNNAGTNFDAVLAVREDHCRLGPVVACNDDAAAPAAASQLSALPVVAGRTYYVVIEGYDGATGDFELTVDSASGAAWQRRLFLSDSPGPSSRHVVASTYDSARAVTVLFGGYNVSGSLDDTWEWDGRWWWERTPAEQPPKRAMAAMAYDTERRVSLLFGGQRSALPLDDTWLWDGHNWSAPSPSHVPPASSGAAMVFDSHRGVAVLFGGWGNSGALAQTWEWDGSDWQNRTPVAGDNPSPRTRAVMVYDAMRGVTLLFGGTDKVGWYGDDTWQWDGRRWHQLFPLTSPEGRERAAMVYDSHRGVAVLFGGEREEAGDDVTLRDTWEWDGTNWQEGPTPPALVPMAASGAAMAYDQLHREVLLSHGAQYDPSDGGRYTVPLAHLYRGCTSASAGR